MKGGAEKRKSGELEASNEDDMHNEENVSPNKRVKSKSKSPNQSAEKPHNTRSSDEPSVPKKRII